MKLKVSRADLWEATVEDKPGGLASRLESLTKTGANLELVLAQRTPELGPGQGVVYVTLPKTAQQEKRAMSVGFAKTNSLHSVRVEGNDAPGIGAKMTRALAAAKINLRGLSAAALGKNFVVYLAFDTGADADKAVVALKKL
jgi:hypothetical protein